MKAIELSTLLWGGCYSPIIPVFGRTPKNWERGRYKPPTPSQILAGYLDGFDPDFVVPVGVCEKLTLDIGHRDSISPEELVSGFTSDRLLNYGFGFFEVLRTFVERELKFSRREPINFTLPKIPRAYGLFFASVFGKLPEDTELTVRENYQPYLSERPVSVGFENLAGLIAPTSMFPKRLISCYLKIDWKENQIFLCDASNVLDIIDYWNLRAAGNYIIPFPIQAANVGSAKNLVRDFVNRNFGPHRHNPNVFYDTTVQKSRSVSEDTAKRIVEAWDIPSGDSGRPKFSLRWWYPRIWSQWAREHTTESITFPYSHEVERRLDDAEADVEIVAEDPKIDFDPFHGAKASFANEFSFRFSGAAEPMAEVLPEGSRELSSAIGRIGYYDWRFSRHGLVFLARHSKDLIFLTLPKAESIMTEWFKERSWLVEPSAPGRIAGQLYRQLGGEYGIGRLRHLGIIRLLGELENEGGSHFLLW